MSYPDEYISTRVPPVDAGDQTAGHHDHNSPIIRRRRKAESLGMLPRAVPLPVRSNHGVDSKDGCPRVSPCVYPGHARLCLTRRLSLRLWIGIPFSNSCRR